METRDGSPWGPGSENTGSLWQLGRPPSPFYGPLSHYSGSQLCTIVNDRVNQAAHQKKLGFPTHRSKFLYLCSTLNWTVWEQRAVKLPIQASGDFLLVGMDS